ncbi:unnamed protein product [Darwinula stevensoni]|uniref:Ig-like domain-containing protein n=1 Tax=Darwinula stevensoni TaxID=69355 RepID=A0A7R8XD54_9CRUS|nr:unnamed protein product [Darwinula stevensoni]CAG0892890.1 unnamed protein product [Darwinula stevensoni]
MYRSQFISLLFVLACCQPVFLSTAYGTPELVSTRRLHRTPQHILTRQRKNAGGTRRARTMNNLRISKAPPQEVSVDSGTPVILECEVWGWPMPDKVFWLRDGAKVEVESTGDLHLKSLSWGDMGEYTCRVENPLGEMDEVNTFVYPFGDSGRSGAVTGKDENSDALPSLETSEWEVPRGDSNNDGFAEAYFREEKILRGVLMGDRVRHGRMCLISSKGKEMK